MIHPKPKRKCRRGFDGIFFVLKIFQNALALKDFFLFLHCHFPIGNWLTYWKDVELTFYLRHLELRKLNSPHGKAKLDVPIFVYTLL